MNKLKKLLKHLSLITAATAMGLGVFVIKGTKVEKPVEEAAATYTNGDAATYYNGIGDATGDSLLSALRSLNGSKRQSTVGYKPMLNNPSTGYYITDPGNGSNTITTFYSGKSNNGTSGLNREHVWPNSRGGSAVEADIHMPRPTLKAENGSRGNSFYVEGKCSSSGGWDPAMESFGDETYRGDSARIIFYCVVASSSLSLVDKEDDSTSSNTMGKLSDLLKWNINYPVLDREKVRNEGAEYLQGNRNPFIDHPEYACKIWGNTNSTTKSICANATYPTEAHTAGIRTDDGYNVGSSNTTVYSLTVGETVNFLPFVDGAYNASVSWSLSNYDVASSIYYGRDSYTNGVTVEGLAAGTSVLTVSYSYDDNGETKYATASVTISVTASGGGGSSSGGTAEGVENLTTATYTVSSTSEVSTTGTAPATSSASYSQTYGTKEQITDGNSATLTLSGYSGKVITGIKLNMHSNANKGAGSFTASVGTDPIANTSGNFNTWYDNTSFGTTNRDINVTLTNSARIVGSGEDVTLTIEGSTNSLYIHSYTITYGTPTEQSGSGTEEATLSSITATGMTQNYTVGDTFSFDGVLLANYSDNTSGEVLPTSVSSPDMTTSGNKTITLSYTEDEVTKTTTYTIYVAEVQKTLSSISVSTAPTKTSYYVGDNFNPAGLVITRTYEDSSSDTYTYSGHTSEFSFTPSLSTSLSASNTTVTITYGGKSTTQAITVTEAPFENTIQQLYSKQKGALTGNTFYGLYMGYTARTSGSKTYYDLYLGNGDYAILVYGCLTSLPSSYTPFETGLSVTGGYLNIYHNLYEVANYVDKKSYDTTISQLTSSQISQYIAPLSTYTVTGDESGSSESDQRIASRLAILSGTVKTAPAKIKTDSDDKSCLVTLANNKDVTVFIKANAGLDYDKLNEVLVVNNHVNLRGFTSFYDDGFQFVNPQVVEASATYGYADFAQDILDLTNSICSSSGDKESSLSGVWMNLEVNLYSQLQDSAKLVLVGYSANKDSSDVTAQAMARYDQICRKYASCTNFIGRSNAEYLGAPSKLSINNTDNNGSITIILVVSLFSTSSLLVLLAIKKKRNSMGR